jgi:hypothetical protein
MFIILRMYINSEHLLQLNTSKFFKRYYTKVFISPNSKQLKFTQNSVLWDSTPCSPAKTNPMYRRSILLSSSESKGKMDKKVAWNTYKVEHRSISVISQKISLCRYTAVISSDTTEVFKAANTLIDRSRTQYKT